MGRKIFISYKYADSSVKQFTNLNSWYRQEDTARSYVDLMEEYFKNNSDHIYKGESDGEDLSQLSNSTIRDTMQSDTLTTVDGTTMKMLVDRIHVRNDGIVVEFKCGVAIEQEYVK